MTFKDGHTDLGFLLTATARAPHTEPPPEQELSAEKGHTLGQRGQPRAAGNAGPAPSPRLVGAPALGVLQAASGASGAQAMARALTSAPCHRVVASPGGGADGGLGPRPPGTVQETPRQPWMPGRCVLLRSWLEAPWRTPSLEGAGAGTRGQVSEDTFLREVVLSSATPSWVLRKWPAPCQAPCRQPWGQRCSPPNVHPHCLVPSGWPQRSRGLQGRPERLPLIREKAAPGCSTQPGAALALGLPTAMAQPAEVQLGTRRPPGVKSGVGMLAWPNVQRQAQSRGPGGPGWPVSAGRALAPFPPLPQGDGPTGPDG